jgi:hypothetical protein
MTIWYIFSGFGIMHQEKSGNPGTILGRRTVMETIRILTVWKKSHFERAFKIRDF